MSTKGAAESNTLLTTPAAATRRTSEMRLNPYAAEFVPGQVSELAQKIINDLAPHVHWNTGSDQQEVSCGPRYDSIWSENYMENPAQLMGNATPFEPHVMIVKTDNSSDATEEEQQLPKLDLPADYPNMDKPLGVATRGKYAGRCCDCSLM